MRGSVYEDSNKVLLRIMMAIIEVNNLTKHYTTYQKEPGVGASLLSLVHRKGLLTKAAESVSFTIEEGELVGFIGPNGAGKTTVLKCLSGILTPNSGNVSILGFNPSDRENEYRRQIGFVTGQKNQLFWDLPPIETFYLNRDLYEIENSRFSDNLQYFVALLQVSDIIKTPTRKLSLGERMKCEIIAALLHEPKVLFLDEPTIGLDVLAQKNIREFLYEYNLRTKATIILTSHSMQDVKKLCKRIIIINKGIIIYDGSLEDVITRYEETKRISVTLTEEVGERTLTLFKHELIEYNFPIAHFSIERKKTPLFVEKLLKNLPVSDLNVEELPLEEAISNIFITDVQSHP